MSLKLPNAPGAGLFKQGYQTYNSEDGAVNRNIAAVREISSMVRTSVGPCGRNKIVQNHIGKVFLTSDAATILKELEIVHPAAKLVFMASEQQEIEMGDATNLVLIFAGELLNKAEDLLRLGLNTTEIAQGYDLAMKYAVEELEKMVCEQINDISNPEELFKVVRSAIASKQYGSEDILAKLVSEAISQVLPKNPKYFNVDNIRVVKIMGSSLDNSQVVRGMVFNREPEGSIKKASKAKVALFTTAIDTSQTETKGTVLLHNAKEMLDFSKGEEAQLETQIKEIADTGLKVVIAGGGIGDLALHYMNKYGILVFKVSSKFDLRRLARVFGATPLARFGAPMPDEMGIVDVVETLEIGGDRVTVFRQEESTVTRTATIIVRGATQSQMDDVERAIDDGVNTTKSMTKDNRLVPGAGATETELATRIVAYGERTPGLLQHAIKRYGEAFEVIPRTLAENAGLDATEVLSRLYAAHTKDGEYLCGVDIDEEEPSGVCDARSKGIYDLLVAKQNAIKLATDAANTVLSVDQIIMAKRAGGPQIPKQNRPGNWDQDD
ncbi:T-complex protein 1 subunit theta [Trichomonascus vanleenenianus]|uniref:chaperonin-containing T-complex subunit CCT8 n=1 Tax=Trichomonascus vanleenenianus TaxID=2268995 RepID=UPI003EC9FE6D